MSILFLLSEQRASINSLINSPMMSIVAKHNDRHGPAFYEAVVTQLLLLGAIAFFYFFSNFFSRLIGVQYQFPQ